jgi:hypothetical protein
MSTPSSPARRRHVWRARLGRGQSFALACSRAGDTARAGLVCNELSARAAYDVPAFVMATAYAAHCFGRYWPRQGPSWTLTDLRSWTADEAARADGRHSGAGLPRGPGGVQKETVDLSARVLASGQITSEEIAAPRKTVCKDTIV